MLKSMTGYGKSVFENEDKKVTIEIRSLNSKQIDINSKIPPLYREKEIAIRNIISQKIVRGKLDLILSIENKSSNNIPLINHEIVKNYYNQFVELKKDISFNESADLLSVIMRLPDSLKTDKEELNDEEWKEIELAINKALNFLDDFRMKEGKILEQDIKLRIENIQKSVREIENFEKERIDNIKNRIEKNSLEFLNNIDLDKNRLEQELLYYIEKIDITEEKVRLNSHCQYFSETINENNPGKKLAFISQEIGREINTIGSKANNLNIQKIVVQMKDELEKIKEQLMNVL